MKTVIINDVSIKEKLKGLIDDDVRLFAQNEFYKMMFDYVPFVTNTLATTVTITKDGVTFNVPYARRQYFGEGFNFSKEKHPLACAKWDEVAMQGRKEQTSKTIENYIRMRKSNE